MVSAPSDITILFKRLEILQNLITVQDAEDIEYQVGKLEKANEAVSESDLAAEVDHILLQVKSKAYGNAMQLITSLLQQYNSITRWIDPEVRGLQAEVTAKSALISSLEEELAELEKLIHDFELRHMQELGYLILNMLSLKSTLARQSAMHHPYNASFRDEYEKAIEEEEDYRGTYEKTIDNPSQDLSDDEMAELKTKFKKISKLTHPDLVDKRFEEEATGLFIKAKQAKDKNNLAVINEIWEYLEFGKPFTLKMESLTDLEELRAETKRLYFLAEQLFHKIRTIKTSDAYLTIAHIEDWDAYFADTKQKLNIELETLKRVCYA